MKKKLQIFLTIFSVFLLLGCNRLLKSEVQIDYGNSEIYSRKDMDEAINIIIKKFSEFEGAKLYNIRYAGDEENNEKNLSWMNELAEGKGIDESFAECIMFKSDFHSPKEGNGAWNYDTDYKDYEWWLARSKNSEWKLMTFGY